jgi:periplasmic protein TonB
MLMTHRYLTYLSSVSLLHLLLIIGGIYIYSHDINPMRGTKSAMVKVTIESDKASSVTQALPSPKEKPSSKAQSQEKAPTREEVYPTHAESLQEASSASGLSQKAIEDLRSMYLGELRAQIESNKNYPLMSRKLGHTGLVVVAFTLLEDGSIINVRVDRPSNFERLDESALEAVKKVGRYKPIPADLGEVSMEIKVPVKFLEL